MLQFEAGEYGNMSEEYRRRIIENNFELMNGQTIKVTTDPNKVPKYFQRLDSIRALKDAVNEEMEGPTTAVGAGLIHNTSLGAKRQAETDINSLMQQSMREEESLC